MSDAVLENMNENKQICHEIQSRIAQLNELSGTDLKVEMDDLKRVLLQNPAACSLLLPEDIGLAVSALKRLIFTAKELSSADKPSTTRKGKAKVDLNVDLSLD
jgi:hypothetical protein